MPSFLNIRNNEWHPKILLRAYGLLSVHNQYRCQFLQFTLPLAIPEAPENWFWRNGKMLQATWRWDTTRFRTENADSGEGKGHGTIKPRQVKSC